MTRLAATASARRFGQWLLLPPQRRALWILAAVFVVLGVAMSLRYPYPFTFPDSGAYVLTAKEGVYNVYRPMGYSAYLGMMHALCPTTGFLFAATFTLWALSTVGLLMVVRYLWGVRDRLFYPLAAAAILWPRMLYSTNFLMSDALFTILTTLWVTSWLVLVRRPSRVVLLLHLLLLWMLWKVRYSGMFYVPVSMLSIAAAWRGRGRLVQLGIAALPAVLFLLFYGTTRAEYRRTTGVDTFSAFSGWQLVNNASVLFPDAKGIAPAAFEREDERALHRFLRSCPDTMFRAERTLSTDYMWNRRSPYKLFLTAWMQSAGMPYTAAWVRAGELYGRYAGRLIRQRPGAYLARFVWPSLRSQFACGEMFEEGRLLENEPLYADYYGLRIDRYDHHSRLFRALHPVRQVGNALFWLALAASAVLFVLRTRRRSLSDPLWQQGALLLLFVVLYLVTSTLASPCTTWRYTMPVYLPGLLMIACTVRRTLCRSASRHKNAACGVQAAP